MARLAFCYYHNMVAILEKSEHNVDFYPIVDFVKASHLRYALTFKPTVYVSHIRQFWSTVKIETTEEGTKILATIDGNLRTVSKSSIRRNLKLNDEAGISSLPDAELFKNLTLMGYNISPNQKFTFQKGSVFPSVEVSHPYHHAVFESKNPSFSGRIVPLFDSMLIPQGEGSGTPTESRHTPSPEAQPTSPTSHSSSSLPPITTANIPLVIPTAPLSIVVPTDSPQLRHYTRRARIAQSSALPPVAEELASPLRDVSQGEACPTVSSLEAEQDRANIAKTSTLPHESTSRVTSLTAEEGSMQQKFDELTALCTSLEGGGIAQSGDDAPIKGRRLDEGDEAAKKGSNDTEEMINVLTSMDAATVLSSGVVEVPTGSGSIPTSGPPANGVPTGSDEVPTVGPIFATATVVTPYTKRKGKKTMVESDTPKKKKAQDQIDVQLERELEEEMARDAHRMNGQIARDAEIARIHAEEELQMLIDGLDRNNETVAKYLQEYDQFAAELPFERREVKETEEVPEDKVKEMIQLVPVKEVYVEALQVKHLIIDWKVHTKGQRSFWKIIKLGGSSANYQFFVDMLKHLDREDLNQLWRLVKETLSIRPPTSDKEMEIWDYPLRKGLTIVMISYKLQVENYSQMANDLILKIYKIANCPIMEFPLPEEIPTASEKSSHCQKKRDATAEKIALLMKSSSNCQSKSYDSYTKLHGLMGGSVPLLSPRFASKDGKLEPNGFCFWKAHFETYVKSKDIDLWQVIQNGDFYYEVEDPETKLMKETSYELPKDDLKKKLGKNNEAKITLYNTLPRKEYERVFMCKTAKMVWHTLIITHQGNSQVKNCKIDLLTQEYEKFSISNEETIDNGFTRFNAIVTRIKSLDPDYSSKNHVRKFLHALPLK
nr:DUF4219 domain-containing protein/UBN2 domain-containing protein [Tanacetum cinerariifolium]